MAFWSSLFRMDLPAGARLQGLDVAFRGTLGTAATAALATLLVLASALVVVLYWRERGKARPWLRAVMAGLRLAAINFVGILLFLPVLILDFQGPKPRQIHLLIDASASMTQRDQRVSPEDRLRVAIAENLVPADTPLVEGGSLAEVPRETSADPTRADLVRKVIEHDGLRLVEGLRRLGPLTIHFFGNRPRAVGETGTGLGWIEAYQPVDTRTALADAIHDLATRHDGDPPAAIVVFSDGRDNASQRSVDDVARACRELQIAIHVYGVGTSMQGNLQLKEITVPEAIFHDDVVAVGARWSTNGVKEGEATLTVTLGGKTVATKRVKLHEGSDQREILTFVPQRAALKESVAELAVSIRHDGHESHLDDNELKRSVRLVDRKVRVLYVENAPRWEYKFLLPALLRDRRVDVRVVLLQASSESAAGGPPYLPAFPLQRADLFAYDLILLGDVPASHFTPERMAWLRDFVKEGGGLVMIAGRKNAPASYLNTPLAEVLPIEFLPATFPADSARRTEPFVPLLSPAGSRAEIMALADDEQENRRIWGELPGFLWHYPVARLRPGAVALMTHPRVKMGDQPMPLFAMHHYGRGLAAFLATDETWRWRYNAQDKYFARFWGQIVYQLGLPHLVGQQKRCSLSLDRGDALLDRPGYVYARLLDAEYRPWTAPEVVGRLECLDDKTHDRTVVFDALPGQPGEYRALLAHDVLGRFRIVLDQPEPAALEYQVTLPPLHEMLIAGMDEERLRALAALSGGGFYREEDLHRLVAAVEPRLGTFTERREVLPWHPLTLLIIVGLVTAEWVLRKFVDWT